MTCDNPEHALTCDCTNTRVRVPVTVRFRDEFHHIGSCYRDEIPMFVAEFKERLQSWEQMVERTR